MNSSRKRTTALSARADLRGIGHIRKISATRATIIDDFEHILVTPAETFGDSEIFLTDKLSLDMQVVYKANRLKGSIDQHSSMATFVCPMNKCLKGDAVLDHVAATFVYAESPKHGTIFFPAPAIKDSVIYEPFVKEDRDISKCLHRGDPISFVAVSEESKDPKKKKCAYAIIVSLNFNQDGTKPMIGIVTNVSRCTCKIWAQHFGNLEFDNNQFRVERTLNLREIFTEGDRITFRAVTMGCGVEGISCVDAVDRAKIEKLRKARTKASMGQAAADYSDNNSEKSTGFNGGGRTASAIVTTGRSHTPDQDVLEQLEQELDELDMDDDIEELDEDEDDAYDPANTDADNVAPADVALERACSEKAFADAEVQVCNMFEYDMMKTLFDDKDIFTMACQRYPALVREMIQLRRNS